jgi:hypothetical protein
MSENPGWQTLYYVLYLYQFFSRLRLELRSSLRLTLCGSLRLELRRK